MRFIRSYYDKNSEETRVIIEHKGRYFFGYTKLHPEDRSNPSEIFGGFIAELRATIKALKYERKLEKEKCEACRIFIKDCANYKNFDKNSEMAKIMYKQLNVRIKKVNKITNRINALYKDIQKMIWNRDVTLKAIERKKSKKDNNN